MTVELLPIMFVKKNGNLNVIGDEIDAMMSKMDSDDLDRLSEARMAFENKMHADEIAKYPTP